MKPESASKRYWLWSLVGLLLIAFALRVYKLGDSSLLGDEAFAIRYWAQSPSAVLATLAGVEPHPLGTFTLFWAWKSLMGDSEFAMRMLSLLGNLIGVAAMAVLGRRLFKSQNVGLVAALLWTINPNLIWHSQDARDYALWAAISVLNLWLLIRATQRSRRIDWALYILGTTFALYIFFLEVFIVVVHGLYIVICQRAVLRRWLGALLIIGVLLIPWFAQGWTLAHSGYGGTAAKSDLSALWTQFFPTFWLGPAGNISNPLFQILLAAIFVASLVFIWLHQRQAAILSSLLIVVPTLLLVIAATKINVFIPRYLIALTPAFILLAACMIVAMWHSRHIMRRVAGAVSAIIVIGLCVLTLISFYTVYQKAPNWRALGALLRENTTSQDAVIVVADSANGFTDPALGYYYSGPASVQGLVPTEPNAQTRLSQTLADNQTVYIVPLGSSRNAVTALLADNSLLADESAGGFHVELYRAKDIKPDEITTLLKFTIGSAQLQGYSLLGSSKTDASLIVLLYWQTPPSGNLKVFVHLLGVPKADGSPLWAQDDHQAQAGRDPYVINLASVPPGNYTLEVGVYDPANGQRVPITDSDSGANVGTSVTLQSIMVTP